MTTGKDIARRATVACRGCGKQILFVTTCDGKTVPLDPTPPVYHRIYDPDSGVHFWIRGSNDPEPTAMVSHFATCRAANDFSGSGQKNTVGRRPT